MIEDAFSIAWSAIAPTPDEAATIDPNQVDRKENTPLHYSAAYALPEITMILLLNGANPNARNASGQTPLHQAASVHPARKETTAALLAAGADPNIQDGIGMTPLHTAAELNNLALIDPLLNTGANLTLKDHRNREPVDFAIVKAEWMLHSIDVIQKAARKRFEPLADSMIDQAITEADNSLKIIATLDKATGGKTDTKEIQKVLTKIRKALKKL